MADADGPGKTKMTRMGQARADDNEEDGSGQTIMKRKAGAAGGE